MPKVKKSDVTVEGGGERVEPALAKPSISKLTVDYPNEGLNDIARKINEIIDRV